MNEEKKIKTVKVRLSEPSLARIHRAARAEGAKTLSDWLRAKIESAAIRQNGGRA